MKSPQHIFALEKNEQRVVILIVLALLAFASVRYYRNQLTQALPTPSVQSSPAPSQPPAEDD